MSRTPHAPAPSADPQSADDLVLADLVQELTERIQRGESVDLDTLVQQHPQFAERLRKLLPTIEAVAQASPTDGPAREFGSPEPGVRDVFVGSIGDYQIVREIGRGGMGIVYEACQLSLNRRVALKVLPFATALDKRALERFQNESQAAARLDHPYIVHVYGVGCDRGVHYYAMQYIEGQSLAEVIAEMRGEVAGVEESQRSEGNDSLASRGRKPSDDIGQNGFGARNSEFGAANDLQGAAQQPAAAPNAALRTPGAPDQPVDTGRSPGLISTPTHRASLLSTSRAGNRRDFYRGVARLGVQIAEALDYAHHEGILHRDVKPGNILLDDEGDVWIADFGLARIGNEGNLTRTGDVIGTLRYASPEQVLGERGLVDQRTDIYSLGATLYEVLTQRPVFGSDDDRKRLLKQITDGEPLPLRRIEPSVPRELETIVLKCLEKEPSDRYATAGDVAADLNRYLAYEPLVVRRAGPIERLMKWSRRHQPWVLSALAAMTLAAFALAVSSAWVSYEHEQTSRAREATATQRALASARQSALREQAYLASIHRIDAAWRHGDFAEARRLLDECVPERGEEDLRGFEWYLLSRIAGEAPKAWRRHDGACYCARFSPDGTLLATAGKDGVRVWAWPGGDEIAHLTPHTGDVNGVAFSPDGTLLATAGDDHSVKILDTRSWQEIHALPRGAQTIAVAFSRDGNILFSGERHPTDSGSVLQLIGMVNVPDWTDKGRVILRCDARYVAQDKLEGLAISSDGRFVGTAGGGPTGGWGRVWEIEHPPGDHLDPDTTTMHSTSVKSIAFAHHRPLWAVSDSIGVVALYELAETRLVKSITGQNALIESIAFCLQDDALVAAGGDGDGTVRLWEFTNEGYHLEHSATYVGAGSLWCAVFSPDGGTIVATAASGGILLFRRDRLQECQRVAIPVDWPPHLGLEFSPDSRTIMAYFRDLWAIGLEDDEPPHVVLRSEKGESTQFYNLAFSPDGAALVTVRWGRCVEAWDAATWNRTAILREGDPDSTEPAPTSALAFREGRQPRLIELSRSEASREFDGRADDRGIAKIVPFEGAPVHAGRFTVRTVVERGLRRTCVEDVDERQVLDLGSRFGATAFSRDGSRLAAGGDDGIVAIWNTRAWGERLTAFGHSSPVISLDFSADGRTLASAAKDGSIKLWHVATGRELMTLQGHSRYVYIIKFSPDGRALASRGNANAPNNRQEIHIWQTDSPGDDSQTNE